MPHPERLYRKAAAHWAACPICTAAGGEEANVEDLCPVGRTLTETWGRAEEAFAHAEYQREAAGRPMSAPEIAPCMACGRYGCRGECVR